VPDRPSSPALAAAVKLLSVKRLTKARLAEKLGHRGYAPDAIADALTECERRKYVDDRAFAQLFVRSVLDRKPLGRMRILQDLVRNGVDADLAAEILDDVDKDEDERIDRALSRLEATRPQDGYGQLGRRLEGLGYGAPSIARALRRRAASRGPLPGAEDFEQHA
jgi:SOS response regulatory protein OraA/RecX